MKYQAENQAKETFDEVYSSPTPHAYVARMAKHEYEICENIRPYFIAAAHLIKDRCGEAWPVQMLDIGCSYGIGAALLKHGCSFDEMVAFYGARAPADFASCCEATRMWLNLAPPACDVRCVGLDSSRAAIRFAVQAGLLECGFAANFEEPGKMPSERQAQWFRSCNLLLSTGAIGYVTDRSLSKILPLLGQDHPGDYGPVAVVSILRMFDIDPIRRCFEHHGFRLAAVPGARLRQRCFSDIAEEREVLKLLDSRGIDTREWEQDGRYYADVYAAGRQDDFPVLLETLAAVEQSGEAPREESDRNEALCAAVEH